MIKLPAFLSRFFRSSRPKALREYKDYNEYVDHQLQKTLDPARRQKWLGEEWQPKVDGFIGIFKRNGSFVEGSTNALCLGARTGQEVAALQQLGIPARGMDLVACEPYVEEGDIHQLRYADGEFDLLFTNVFDHSLYPDKFISEMERVCRPGGHIILHLKLGSDIDEFSATEVADASSVLPLFKRSTIVASRAIDNGFDTLDWEIVAKRK